MHRSLVKGVKLKINRISNPRRLEYSYSFWRPNRFPLNNFKHYLTLFSKFFSSFPHGTCSLSVFRLIFSLGWSSPPRRWSPVNRATHHISFGLHSQTTRLVERQRRGSFKSQRPLVGTCRLLWPRSKKDRLREVNPHNLPFFPAGLSPSLVPPSRGVGSRGRGMICRRRCLQRLQVARLP